MASTTQTRNYDRSNSVVFFKTREAFGELSNMCSGFPLRVADVQLRSSEALYQCCRFPHLPEVQERIIAQKSPMTAKMVTKPYRSQTRPDWDDVRVAIMKWCLKVKLVQNRAEFEKILLQTDDKPIVEKSRRDPFWGAIPDKQDLHLKGVNVLGRLLMELRELLKTDPSALNAIDPVPIPNFCLLGQPIEQIARPHLVHDVEGKIASDAQKALEFANGASANGSKPIAARLAGESQTPRKPSKKSIQQIELFELSPPQQAVSPKSKQASYHVLPSRRGGWDVLRDGAKRASNHFQYKRDAMNRGRELASKNKMELVVHDMSGKVLKREKARPATASKKRVAKHVTSQALVGHASI